MATRNSEGNIEMSEEEYEQWKNAKKLVPAFDMLKNLPMPHRMTEFYNLMQRNQEKAEIPDLIACGKGCSFCCHDRIMLTEREAEYIKEINPAYNVERNQAQKDRDFWSLSFKNRACIFLKNNECTIYDRRPYICRTHNIAKENTYEERNAIPEIDCIIENGRSATVNRELKTSPILAGEIWLVQESKLKIINDYFE